MFDIVIVGAGSAGCVLAHRLSSDPKRKVALIEAGGAQHRAFKVRAPGGPRYRELTRLIEDAVDKLGDGEKAHPNTRRRR